MEEQEPWWAQSPDEIGKMKVVGRAECKECGGKCCDGSIAPIHYNHEERGAYIPATDEVRQVMARHGLPMAPISVSRLLDGRIRVEFRCPLRKTGCLPEQKPDLCKRFPMEMVVRERKPLRRNCWCQLARNLRDEWLSHLEGNGDGNGDSGRRGSKTSSRRKEGRAQDVQGGKRDLPA